MSEHSLSSSDKLFERVSGQQHQKTPLKKNIQAIEQNIPLLAKRKALIYSIIF